MTKIRLSDNQTAIKNCHFLLQDFEEKRKTQGNPTCQFLSFDLGKSGQIFLDCQQDSSLTVYNPTKPISRHGKEFIFGRVEPRENEDSRVLVFERFNDRWKPVSNRPFFNLQDPFFVSDVDGWYVFGGVEVKSQENGKLKYRTVFYRWRHCMEELGEGTLLAKPFAVGPWGMKDIRLIEISSGRIAVFTRPQGKVGGKGKIAYIEIASLDKLEEAIPKATIIENQFHDLEWGGANELHLLKNGKIGVLGHIAHRQFTKSENRKRLVRHYYAMAFCFDPETKKASEMEILTTAKDFPNLESKKPELGGIIFSGGLERLPDGKAHLYVGIGDVAAGCATIPDPFSKYEK